MPTHLLSKSTYMRGRQCPKALWYAKNRRDLMPPVDARQQAIFDSGTEVGLLAQKLFPGGVDLSPEHHYDYGPSIAATQAAIARGENVIYEAAFLHDEVLAALDILVRTEEGWEAYEVKSSSSVKDYQVNDVALQAHVIEGSGLPLADVSIVHLNTGYVRQGALDVQRLFTITSVKERVAVERRDVPARIAELKAMLALGKEPQVDIGPQCNDPFPCDFQGHCWAHVPGERSVFELVNGRSLPWELYERGILRLEDIPEEEALSRAQQRQVEGWRTGRVVVEQKALRRWLGELRYPLYHFDFETFMPAVPLYDGTHPFQQVPFQYSIHVQASHVAEAEHREFLADGAGDPRAALVERLLRDLGTEGDILAYHADFERSRLRELARDLPHHADGLAALVDRVKDLEVPFKNGWYYAPGMNGRTSIKMVLPALVPDLGYADLAINEGGMASLAFTQLLTGRYTGDVDRLRQDLLAYCRLDTLAMVRILDVLERAVQ